MIAPIGSLNLPLAVRSPRNSPRYGCVTSSLEAPTESDRVSGVWLRRSFAAAAKSVCGPTNCTACDRAPFDIGPQSLFVAYYVPAEMGCFIPLGWPMPQYVLDLYVEHRVETNGLIKGVQ